jgi:hypothetical protein
MPIIVHCVENVWYAGQIRDRVNITSQLIRVDGEVIDTRLNVEAHSPVVP